MVRRVGAAVAVLMIFGSAPPAQEMPAAGEELAMKLRDHVVRITANWRDGSTQHGFGFIVGERDDDLYIVTADHVVRGRLPDELAETIVLTFFSHQGQEFQARLLGTRDADRDVAVLLAERPGGLELQPEIMRRSREALPKRGTRVWYVGRSGRWYVPSTPGTVNSVDLDERIWIDGLNVQVGTSGAPLVAADGIVGMVVADDAGGVSRAVGIGFIERAFGHWAHPWQLQATEPAPPSQEETPAPAPRVATPQQPAPAPAREPSGPQDTAPPAIVFNPGQIRRAIEADLARYDPAAPQASAYRPGMLAPTLAILEPEVRFVDAQTLEVASYVTLEGLDLGYVTATVTPSGDDQFAVAVAFDRMNWRAAECAVDLQQQAFDLTWNSRIAAFTELRADFGPIEVICPDLSLAAARFRIESAVAEDEDALWSGHLQAALEGLQVTGATGESFLRTDAAELRLAFTGFDLDRRTRLLASLPAHYWPRRAALLGVAFDFVAADLGALPENLAQLYARRLAGVDLAASLEGLAAVIKDGAQSIDVTLSDGAIEARSTAPAGLSYRHDGLSVKGAEIGFPQSLALDLRFDRGEAGALLAGVSDVQSEQGLVDFLQAVGPLSWQVESAGWQSSAQASGQVWAKPGAPAPSATAVLLSDDPTAFLLETFLRAPAQEVDPVALRRAVEETVLQVAQVVKGSAGPQYRFEIAVDFERETVMINGADLDDLNLFLNDACTRYGC